MSISNSLFPRLYHAHHAHENEDLPFWLELAAQQGSPLLELGCGTGRVLMPLTQAGYQVYGLDRDSAMLAVLRLSAPTQLSSGLHLLQSDMTAFHLGKRFAMILLPCNTFSTLAQPARLATLERVAMHLLPDGLFAASLPNPGLLKRLPAASDAELEDIFPHPLDGEPVQVSSAWVRQGDLFTLTWHYDHLLPDGRVERLSARVQHHLAPAEVHLAELRAAGLEIRGVYGDFGWSPFNEMTSPTLILVAAFLGA